MTDDFKPVKVWCKDKYTIFQLDNGNMYHFGKLGTVDHKRPEKLPFRADQVKEIVLSGTHAFVLTTEGRLKAMGSTANGILPSKLHEK